VLVTLSPGRSYSGTCVGFSFKSSCFSRGRRRRRLLCDGVTSEANGKRIMARSLPTSLRSLLWHTRVEERDSSELGLQHVPRFKAFDLAGGQVRPIRPKSPSALHPSAAFPAGRKAALGAAVGA
jgi:hypothetical protein